MFHKKIKVGVIGIGSMGFKHAVTYLKLPDMCELTGVYDTSDSKNALSLLKAKRYYDLDALLNDVDAVTIAVPTRFHYKIALKCISAGVHILLEKPITDNVLEAESLISAAKNHNVKLQIGHIERFNPAFVALKSVIDTNDIISVDAKRFNNSNGRISDADVIIDLMIHDIELVHNLIKNKKDEYLDANGYGNQTKKHVDYAKSTMLFENQIVVSLEASRVYKDSVRKMSIKTKSKLFTIDFLHKTLNITDISGFVTEHKVLNNDSLNSEICSFLECIYNNTMPEVTADDGLNALKTACRIQESVYGKDIIAKSLL